MSRNLSREQHLKMSHQNKAQYTHSHQITLNKSTDKVIDKISAPNTKIIDQITLNISLITVQFSKTIGPSNSMPLVLIITESLDRNLIHPRPFYYNEQPQTRNYWTEPSDSPPFVHPAYANRPVYRFPTKNTPQNLLRQV